MLEIGKSLFLSVRSLRHLYGVLMQMYIQKQYRFNHLCFMFDL